MNIRLLRSVKHDGVWHDPGARLPMDDRQARTLIRKKAAESMEDISSPEDIDEEEVSDAVEALMEIDGVNDELANRLIEAGFVTVEDVANADPDDLKKIKGIGKRTVVEIQESADDLVSSSDDE